MLRRVLGYRADYRRWANVCALGLLPNNHNSFRGLAGLNTVRVSITKGTMSGRSLSQSFAFTCHRVLVWRCRSKVVLTMTCLCLNKVSSSALGMAASRLWPPYTRLLESPHQHRAQTPHRQNLNTHLPPTLLQRIGLKDSWDHGTYFDSYSTYVPLVHTSASNS